VIESWQHAIAQQYALPDPEPIEPVTEAIDPEIEPAGVLTLADGEIEAITYQSLTSFRNNLPKRGICFDITYWLDFREFLSKKSTCANIFSLSLRSLVLS
jgi:hypothetical protein